MADAKVNIKRDDCVFRARYIERPSYNVELFLDDSECYMARSTVCFNMKAEVVDSQNCTHVDVNLKCKELVEVVINGTEFKTTSEMYDGSVIRLDISELKSRNIVEITYRSEYGNKGCGLHKYVDPADNKTYLYSQFESPYCHTMMPVFEQPDLKATFSLSTYAAPSWKIITNENVMESKESCEAPTWVTSHWTPKLAAIKYTAFYSTPPLSCYLYALCGGEYLEYKADPAKYGAIPPMRIFVRETLKKYMTDEYLDMFFSVSTHTVKWFSDFMRVQYPYNKIDHIFCPEYNWGAMENVGCITYTENCLFKQRPSTNKYIAVCNVIIHEIAHQWFGNLITMKWWDDLWLNEAFATYMSSWAQDTYSDHHAHCWMQILERGLRAQMEDSRKTTHPIACGDICNDTQQSEIIFDGISYGKGSMFLRMLCKFIGAKAFKQGVQMYFMKYQYSNAQSEDLLRCFDYFATFESGEVMNWCKQWLYNKGVLRLEYDVVDRDGAKYMDIQMGFEKFADPVLKRIPLNIELYSNEGRISTLECILEAVEKQSIKLEGDKVEYGLLNAGVHAYVRCVPSERICEFFIKNYPKLENYEDRLLILKTVDLMAKEGHITFDMYRQLFLSSWNNDTSLYIRECAAQDFLGFVKSYVPASNRQECFDWLHNRYMEGFSRYPESQTQIVDYMISIVSGPALTKWGLDTFQKKSIESDGKTYNLTESQLKNLLPRLARDSDLLSDDLLSTLLESINTNNDSDFVSCKIRCEVARPDIEVKKKIWQELVKPNADMSQTTYADKSAYFIDPMRPDLLEPFIDAYFEAVPDLFDTTSHFLARGFISQLNPTIVFPDANLLTRLESIVNNTNNQFTETYGFAQIDVTSKRLIVADALKKNKIDWNRE